MGYQPIENYGIVGNLHTIALVGLDGSVEYMCFPNFDSPSLFASLLDSKKGGKFRISPVLAEATRKQLYLSDTNVLLTRFLSNDGVAEIYDYMPVSEVGQAHQLIRQIKVVRGKIKFRMDCDPKFDYGRAKCGLKLSGEKMGLWESEGGPIGKIRIQSTVPLQAEGTSAWSEFELVSGEQATFVIGEADHNGKPFPMDEDFLKKMLFDTIRFWKEWIGRSQYQGRWREMVNRSALTLKLLTFQPLGSMVAAPTFGLPEEVGGERNWDYRYTWIRDASFAVGAFMRLGYTDEAGAFMKWVQKRCGEPLPDGSLQIMFGLDGQKSLEEEILPDWEGYRGSKPVRIGNLAHHQTQIDIYGELMDAVYRYDELGKSISHDFWQDLVRLMDWVCAHWQDKGDGIWESRGGPQEFLHNRVMCWVALDRAIHLARNRAHPAPLARWEETRDHIYVDIYSNFWDEKRQTFVQRKGSSAVDASSLLMPLLKFIGPTDPRWLSTLAAIKQDLLDDSLVYRYRNDGNDQDGLKGSEGTFTMCSFWYVECLSRAGRLDEAQFLFEKLMGYANHVGLYSEELSQKGEHLGNFPQAFTHIALIRAAFDLNDRLNARTTL